MKKIFIIILLVLMSACSKKEGVTTSKVKLFSGGRSALLTTKANNGMVLYGRSTDGKTFTKKIDADTVDLILPNGTWNFYAISWELLTTAPVVPDFTGKTYCGKSPSLTLGGVDASIQIDLTNPGCSDADFSAYSSTYGGDIVLPKPNILNCKNLAGLTSSDITKCDQNLGANFNKGYATSYKIVAYEYANFGLNNSWPSVKIAESACVLTDSLTLTGLPDTTGGAILNNIRIPTTVENGLRAAVQVFYSPTGCDASYGVDEVPIIENPRMKILPGTVAVSVVTTFNMFVQASALDVCRPPRLTPGNFAAGFGTVGSPYAICTKEQFNLVTTNFTAASYPTLSSSFDLLTDINFAMATIAPIGDALATNGGNATNGYSGTFNGQNHKISNFVINCRVPSGTADNNDVGLFRNLQSATIKNLTLNSSVVMCKDGNNIGLLAGTLTNSGAVTALENLKIHGHGEGANSVGGAIGNIMNQGGGTLTVSRIHVRGDLKGIQYVGGFFGNVNATTGTFGISQSSFRGSLRANNYSSNGTPVDSWVGGIVGRASFNSPMVFDQLVVKADNIEGSTLVGGFAGETNQVDITNSYVEANLHAYASTDGTTLSHANIGGAIGRANSGTLANVLVANGIKSSNRNSATDHTYGGIVGSTAGTAPTCISNTFYTGDQDGLACGTFVTQAQATTQATYAWDFATIWAMPDNTYDIPRLRFETAIENDVPYLKRDCSGHYATQMGAGTATDPKWICSETQLDSMRADHTSNFILKKNIFYSGTTGAFTPFPVGVYKLDGNGYGLQHFTLTIPNSITASLNYGIFENLQSGSLIKNLTVTGAGLMSNIGTVAGNPVVVSAGAFAGVNAGTILNVQVNQSTAALNAIATANSYFYFGGAVGINTGIISESTFDIQTAVNQGSYPAGAVLNASSVVAKNQGIIVGVKGHASLARILNCTSSEPVSNTAQESLGVFVAKNELGAIIKEVESQGELRVDLTPSNSCTISLLGNVSPFVAHNTGTITDFLVNPKMFYAGGSAPAPEILAFNSGTVARGFATFETTDANKIIPQSHQNVGTWDANANPSAFSINAPTCDPLLAGKYYNVTVASASTSFGPVAIGDFVMCDGTNNIILSSLLNASVKNQIDNVAAMTDVLYLVRTPTTRPSLIAGRYFDQDLSFSLASGGTGLRVDTIETPTLVFDHSIGWTVGTDFFNPGTNAWMLDFLTGSTSTTRVPKLVRADGNMEQIGPAF